MGEDWYRSQSALTDPGRFAPRLDGLPGEVPGLVRVVQGLVVQPGRDDPDPWTDDRRLRFVEDMLGYLVERDGRPLSVPRVPAERVRGNCRNSATLLVAILRHQGVPARKRTGFARYIAPGRAIIHEIAEVADGGRWALVDPDVPLSRQEAYLGGGSDLWTADAFVSGGDAWLRLRSGTAGRDEFEGAGAGPGLRGARQALLQDLDGLNRVELLSRDLWGPGYDEAADPALLDRAAELTLAPDERHAELRRLYEASRGPAVRERVEEARRSDRA